MIPLAIPRPTINGSYYSAGFFRLKIDGHTTYCSFVMDGENPAILPGPCYILPQKMLHETANSRESTISCNGGVPALRFDIVQKGQHGAGFNIIKSQVRHGFPIPIRQEQK
jgi:hypothetical protein